MGKYNAREPVYATIGTGAGALKYVFETNIPSTLYNDLGLTAIPDITKVGTGAFYAANAPKPRRARKKNTATGYDSSFISDGTVQTARAAGWVVTPPRKRAIIPKGTTNAKSFTVFVNILGIKYAWNIATETATKLTDATMTALGIEVATKTDEPSLVWGASVPKPARVQLIIEAGTDGADVITTFIDPLKEDNLPAGFKVVKPKVTWADY